MDQPVIAQCDAALKAETRVVAERGQIAPATNFTLEQIAALAKRSGAQDSAPRGFYMARVTEQIQVNLDHEAGGGCIPRIMIELHPRLAERRIEIGGEIVTSPCLYDAVLDHYRAKAAADDAAFAAYADIVAARPRKITFALPAARADGALDDMTRTEIEHRVKSVVDHARPPFHDARVAARHAVDTPDELRRLSQACGRNA
jgi:uncharacterized membrane protein YebE (DUF533 family)